MICLKSRLNQWKNSSFQHLCLDLRSTFEYNQQHLVPSTHIPLEQLHKRMAELPPKHIPFALVTTTIVQNNSFLSTEYKTGEQWLLDRGWQPRIIFRPNSELCFWPKARLAGYVNEKYEQQQSWIMFSPHPLLKDYMDLIVTTLQQNNNMDERRKVLDIGCGSGRDLTWLLLHQRKWCATGVDYLSGARERFETMTTLIKDRVQFIRAKVQIDGTWQYLDIMEQHQHNEKKGDGGMMTSFVSNNKNENFNSYHKDQKTKMMTTRIESEQHHQQQQQYDLVMTFRFFIRPVLWTLPCFVKPGGILMISHFVDIGDYQQPKKEKRLRKGELNDFARRMDLTILVDRLDTTEDGNRTMHSMIFQKRKS
ncbi:uncharacterized protein BX664DRAFT_354912 [Halteromyces radiatus]|uniref:uncharacterized protein n=1 Tax=Halteromyces radiatus TaxID=101107 RepID=UPI0022202D11|nr:uncharacterized protein BX664DRAFT_354912 [Halteromyces radiatus]KAI8099502.1 hypothetical protein BX664DRAFT_354912 [Halteromyces radiatus]